MVSFAHIISTFFRDVVFSMSIIDIIDIAVVAFLTYIFILIIKRTQSMFVFFGFAFLGTIYLTAKFFNLYITTVVFQTALPYIFFILIVIFQRELRYFFEWLATLRFLSFLKPKTTASDATLNDIVAAVIRLAETKTGALIVFVGRQSINRFINGGVTLGGRISVPLLLSIFDDSSPGHDGAVIVNNNRIEKFGARLPLAEKFEYEHLGTRHCAALGLSERSDAFVVVVSEERGAISYAQGHLLTTVQEPIELKDALQGFLHDKKPVTVETHPLHELITHNSLEKVIAIMIALVTWFFVRIV